MAVSTEMMAPVAESPGLSYMIKIMGLISGRNEFSYLGVFSIHLPLIANMVSERKREERGCCLHPFARKELTEHTAEQVGQDC